MASFTLSALGVLFLALSASTPIPPRFGFRGADIIFALSFSTVGAVVDRRRPQSPVGWLLCAGGLVAPSWGSPSTASTRSSPGLGCCPLEPRSSGWPTGSGVLFPLVGACWRRRRSCPAFAAHKATSAHRHVPSGGLGTNGHTLVDGLLTTLLGVVYAGLVLVLGQLFGGIGNEPPSWAVAGATLAVAALLQPARRRIQQANEAIGTAIVMGSERPRGVLSAAASTPGSANRHD
jgi:hypothetical protein